LKSRMVLIGMSSDTLLNLLRVDFPKLSAQTLSRYMHGTVGTPQQEKVMKLAELIVGTMYDAGRSRNNG